MATDWVIDASIACKLVKIESDSPAIRSFIASLEPSTRILAPGHLRYEVGNACTRNGALGDLEQSLRRLAGIVATLDPTNVVTVLGGLSYYDAAYLALAVEQKAGLLTADDKLRKAAKKHGLEVAP